MAKPISILGSTGSIGEQTLDVVASFPERYRVVALGAGRNVEKLVRQIEEFHPSLVCVANAEAAAALRAQVTDPALRIVTGDAGLCDVAACGAQLVVSALVGAVGLEPTLAAIRAGAHIALANKEVLVMAGALVLREVQKYGVQLLPVDSEHSAVFQALMGQRREDLRRIVLTASGGPFRTWSAERIAQATPQEALQHPRWKMGPKITIDSATLMNKGLEVIEARWLFELAADEIDVLVHPQSVIHSLVEFRDQSVLAQLSLPDMRGPISLALAYPERLPMELPSLDLAAIGRLEFEEPDLARFPCLGLAYRALQGGEAAPAVLNAANEIAVQAFLDGAVNFSAIASSNAAVLEEFLAKNPRQSVRDLQDVRGVDAWARERAQAELRASRYARVSAP